MADLSQIGLVVLLVVLNALFAGTEVALISLRAGQIERLRERGRAGEALAELTQDPNRFLATIQIGITLAGFMASATAAVSLADPLVPALSVFGNAAQPVAVILVTVVLAFFTLLFGELAPKRIAMQHPEGWSLAAARPLNLLASLSRPVVWLLGASTNLVVRLAGSDPQRHREDVTEEELRDLVATQMSLTPEERQVISGALEVGERTLRDAKVPRHLVFSLPEEMRIEEARARVLESGHHRIPVYRSTPDEIVGFVQLRELVDRQGWLHEIASPLEAFPESAGVLTVLRSLQQSRQKMALVIDEHGGFDGIVTMEDLIEEIVGEIYDEYDRDVVSVVRHRDGSLVLPGTYPVHDLIDLGIVAPEGQYSTVAGLILDQLGHLPDVGESIDLDGWHLAVRGRDGQAISRVAAIPAPEEDAAAEGQTEG